MVIEGVIDLLVFFPNFGSCEDRSCLNKIFVCRPRFSRLQEDG